MINLLMEWIFSGRIFSRSYFAYFESIAICVLSQIPLQMPTIIRSIFQIFSRVEFSSRCRWIFLSFSQAVKWRRKKYIGQSYFPLRRASTRSRIFMEFLDDGGEVFFAILFSACGGSVDIFLWTCVRFFSGFFVFFFA